MSVNGEDVGEVTEDQWKARGRVGGVRREREGRGTKTKLCKSVVHEITLVLTCSSSIQ